MDILIITKKGKAITIPAGQFPKQNRGGIGIKALTLAQDDEVVAVISITE